MSVSGMSEEKQTHRRQALARRQAFHADHAERAAIAVCRVWDEFAALLPPAARVIAAYAAAGSEIGTAGLMHRLARQGYRLALPVTAPDTDRMIFRAYLPGDKLVKGGFDMLEPEETQAMVEPDVVLMPLVGFDEAGTRLGRGGGHYDRALAGLRSRSKVLAVGLAYEVQYFESLPCATHDEKLNAVLTEDCVRVFDV